MRTSFQALGALMLLAGFESIAQTVRVTAWDMANNPRKSGVGLNEAAQQLKTLAPDVILLRGVTGWKMCAPLGEALRPLPYHVVACSAFGDNAKFGTNYNQTAILARKVSYFSWSEPWKTGDASSPGGLTFAALEIAGHRVGFLSLNLAQTDAAVGPATQQCIDTLNSFRGWSNNRIEGFVVASFRAVPNETEAAQLLQSVGFLEASGDAAIAAGKPIVEGHLVPNADSPRGLLLSKARITCDFDFNPPPIVVIATNSAPVVASQTTFSTQPSAANPSTETGLWWVSGGLGLVLLAIVTMLFGIRRRLNRLQAQNALVPVGSYNVVIAPPTSGTTTALVEAGSYLARVPSSPTVSQRREAMLQQGLFMHLTRWLKQAFVQRLINDRQKMLDDQTVAVRKVSSVDERLARLETKIQQQTAAYEKEIELLNQKLLTAREENLELIRSQIKFLKSEMDTTRARVLESEAL
jgi:uncharacterized coiled-coil protein SlyX